MSVRTFKPITPGQRFKSVNQYDEVTSSSPERSLLQPMRKSGGRNNLGRVTSRRRGGGQKRFYRIIDFRRDKLEIPAKVAAIEYDPNRSANIALLNYADGEKRYILAPLGLEVGQTIVSGDTPEIRPGNAMPLEKIPLGTFIHNIEMKKDKGGQLARVAGSYAQIMAKENSYAQLRLPSGEVRLVRIDCRATIGQVGNTDHENVSIGKAGRSRHMGRRPKVRGVAMNPVDHPMGGGEGKSSGGRHPCTPWGKPTKGYKTRKSKKASDRLIVKRRK